MYPTRLRSALERSILIHLSGPAAEQLRPDQPATQRYALERRDDRLALATAKAALTHSDRMLLARGDAEVTESRTHDEHKARDDAYVLAGLRASALLEFLRMETAAFVRTRDFRRLLDALAQELVDHTDLGAREVRRTLQQVPSR
jgi:AmiR/NasT family two-component response regulator